MSPNNGSRGRLLQMLREKALRRAPVVISSGASSTYHINCQMVARYPVGFQLIGSLLAIEIFNRWEPVAVGGLERGADPMAFAVMAYCGPFSAHPVRTFSVRQSPKTHGLNQALDGDLNPGDKVVIVDDVLTSGASIERAIERVQAVGAAVLGVAVLVDREAGGRGKLEAAGYAVVSVFRASEILAEDSAA